MYTEINVAEESMRSCELTQDCVQWRLIILAVMNLALLRWMICLCEQQLLRHIFNTGK
jgi:hypothetical protein